MAFAKEALLFTCKQFSEIERPNEGNVDPVGFKEGKKSSVFDVSCNKAPARTASPKCNYWVAGTCVRSLKRIPCFSRGGDRVRKIEKLETHTVISENQTQPSTGHQKTRQSTPVNSRLQGIEAGQGLVFLGGGKGI